MVELIRRKDVDKAVRFWEAHLRLVSEFVISDPNETVLDVLY
jgi:hypothetical protein